MRIKQFVVMPVFFFLFLFVAIADLDSVLTNGACEAVHPSF